MDIQHNKYIYRKINVLLRNGTSIEVTFILSDFKEAVYCWTDLSNVYYKIIIDKDNISIKIADTIKDNIIESGLYLSKHICRYMGVKEDSSFFKKLKHRCSMLDLSLSKLD